MEGSAVKVIPDTSVYIPFINKGIAYPVFEMKTRPLLYMSAVVLEELYAGAFDKVSVKLLDRIYRTFKDTGRLIVPDADDWQKSGRIVAKLGEKYGFEDKFLSKLLNDILIALSARRIGAFLATLNLKDFLRIKEFLNFKML